MPILSPGYVTDIVNGAGCEVDTMGIIFPR